jgi:predicted ATPase
VPATVVVGGEAGVGKTRLVREFLHYASAHGAATMTGSCFELTEASLPYAPFVEALRRLVHELEPSGGTRSSPPRATSSSTSCRSWPRPGAEAARHG